MKLSHSIARLPLFSCLRRRYAREKFAKWKKMFFLPSWNLHKSSQAKRGHERVVRGQIQFQRCRSCRFADASHTNYASTMDLIKWNARIFEMFDESWVVISYRNMLIKSRYKILKDLLYHVISTYKWREKNGEENTQSAFETCFKVINLQSSTFENCWACNCRNFSFDMHASFQLHSYFSVYITNSMENFIT